MADWFKFYNDSLDSKGMQFAISEQPLVTSVLLVIMSEASKGRSSKIKWADQDFELIGFARKINVSVPIFNQCIGLLERVQYITRRAGYIHVNGWDKLQSDYAKGMDRGYYKKTSKPLASLSEVSTVRVEEKREEEKRIGEDGMPPIFSVSDKISKEQELQRIGLELSKCGQLSDYTKGSTKHARILTLQGRRSLLRGQLGVIA